MIAEGVYVGGGLIVVVLIVVILLVIFRFAGPVGACRQIVQQARPAHVVADPAQYVQIAHATSITPTSTASGSSTNGSPFHQQS